MRYSVEFKGGFGWKLAGRILKKNEGERKSMEPLPSSSSFSPNPVSLWVAMVDSGG